MPHTVLLLYLQSYSSIITASTLQKKIEVILLACLIVARFYNCNSIHCKIKWKCLLNGSGRVMTLGSDFLSAQGMLFLSVDD